MTDCRLKTIRIPANQSITIDTDIVLSADTWRNSQIYGYVCDESFVPLYNLSVGKTQEFLWDDYSVSVSATKVYDGDVMIIVTQEGKELSDIKDSEDIIWAGKINGNETADVKLKMNAELASGCYNAYFISEGQDELMPIYYINKTSANNVIAQIKDAALRADTAEINELLINNKKDLQIEISYSDNMDFTMASKIIASYIGDNGDFGGNLLEAVKIINGATVAEAASGGYIADLFKYSDKIGIASGRLSELYQKNFVTDVFKQNVTARLKGKRFETFAEFDSAIYEAFVLQTVKMPDGIDNLKAVIDEFYREIGLSTSNCSNAVLREVTNREFYSYADLKTALNNAENSAPSASGGSIGGVTYSASVKATDSVNKPILKDIYSDLGEAKWASDAIIKLTEMGIVKGKGNDEFKPNDFITREEFVTMVVNAFASDENIAEITFSDVKETDWFYGCVSRGFGARLIRGISEEEFGVGRDIIRQDMAVIIKRSADYYGIILDETAVREPLSDFEAISDYAKDEVQILYCNGIVNGVGDAFEPFERATRAQAALLIYTLLMSI